MADSSPPVPGRAEAAFPVTGGWVQVVVDTTFTPADDVTAPAALRTVADFVRAIDPQALREAVGARTRSVASDIYAIALDVVADMLEGES